MTFVVELTAAAAADLELIGDYIAANRSSAAAAEWTATMLERVSHLAAFPARGAVPRELEAIGRKRYRQIVQGKYRIFYRVEEARVFVFLIADGRRDMAALLRERLLAPHPS